MQETVNSCDHFRTEIRFLIDVLLGVSVLTRDVAFMIGHVYFFLTKDQDNRNFVVRSFDWSYIFDRFAAGSI